MTVRAAIAAGENRKLVRKIQTSMSFLAPVSVDLPDALTTTTPGNFIDLKTAGWIPVGLVTPEGYQFGRDIETDEIFALGHADAVREDIMKVTRSISFNMLETGRKQILRVYHGTDLTGVTPATGTSEIVFDEPAMPENSEWRFLTVGVDGPADEEWIMGRGFPRVKLTGGGEENWQQEGGLTHPVTLKPIFDEEYGTAVRHYMGGTAVEKYKDLLGFAA